jgi:hypothetical protein
VVLALETPIPFTTEGGVIAETEVPLQVEVALSPRTIEVARWCRYPTIQLEFRLGIVEFSSWPVRGVVQLIHSNRPASRTHNLVFGISTSLSKFVVQGYEHLYLLLGSVAFATRTIVQLNSFPLEVFTLALLSLIL